MQKLVIPALQIPKSSSLKLILVRHAETESDKRQLLEGRSNYPITDRGKAQIAKLIMRLGKEGIKIVYSSPIIRAIATVSEIAEMNGLMVLQEDALIARNYGIYEEQSYGAMKNGHRLSGKEWVEFKPENGESIREVEARAVKFLQGTIESFSKGTALFCTHGYVIHALAASLVNVDIDDVLRYCNAENACAWVLQLKKGEVQIVDMPGKQELEDLRSGRMFHCDGT